MKKRNKNTSYNINISIGVSVVYWLSIIVFIIPSYNIH